jgi:hypothetical protein
MFSAATKVCQIENKVIGHLIPDKCAEARLDLRPCAKIVLIEL